MCSKQLRGKYHIHLFLITYMLAHLHLASHNHYKELLNIQTNKIQDKFDLGNILLSRMHFSSTVLKKIYWVNLTKTPGIHWSYFLLNNLHYLYILSMSAPLLLMNKIQNHRQYITHHYFPLQLNNLKNLHKNRPQQAYRQQQT